MPEALYDLVVLQHSSTQPVETLVRTLLNMLEKQDDSYLEYKLSEALLFTESKTAILEGLTLREGQMYQQRFRACEVETELRPTLQLIAKIDNADEEDMNNAHVCPACEHEQPRAKAGMNVCVSCGVVGEKFTRVQKKDEVFLREKRKLEESQSKAFKEAQERARYDEDERLRQEAKRRLGLEKKKRPLDILVGVTAVTLMGVAGFFINQTLTSATDTSTEITGIAGSKGTPNADTSTAAGAVDGSGKTIKISVAPPGGNKITMSGISDPMDRPTVEGSSLLPGESAPGTQATATGVQLATTAGAATLQSSPAQTGRLSATELESLKASLHPSTPEQFFEKVTPEEFTAATGKLDRLLALDKPELAITFTEEVKDHYAAARMLLKVARSENRQNREKYKSDILRSLRTRSLQAADTPQHPLITAGISQASKLLGDNKQSNETLEEAIQTMERNISITHAEQKMALLLQIAQDQRADGNREQVATLLQQVVSIADQIPPEDKLGQSRALTQVASGSVAAGDFAAAAQWLEKVPDPLAKTQLLSYLQALKSKY